MLKAAGNLRRFATCLSGIVAVAALAATATTPAAAQSRAVVQPLPPAGVKDLNRALMRLARNTRDINALIDAGNASLQLNDIDAAIGFFGRADELSPGNPKVKVGLAGAFVRSERPIEALRLFFEAEQAGVSTVALAEERGLAYDLVGDPVSAQAQYARAMAVRPNDELIRRMALSQAISGDRLGFEKTLYPLMERRDFAAYRTRAFGLAILGEEGEAVAIAEAVMPPDLSARMTPYLRYMNRLTKAQQAAAGNLGIFPRASQIGRDDPRVAQYAGAPGLPSVQTADAGLAPQGKPLGPVQSDSVSPRRRPDRNGSSVRNLAADEAADTLAQTVPVTAPTVAPTPTAPKPGFNLAPGAARNPVALATPPANPPAGVAAPMAVESVAVVQQVAASTPESIPQAASPTAPAPVAAAPSVADAFAGLTLSTVAPDKTGAVDISTIEPKREIARAPEPKPVAKPVPPKNPSRVWVQVATGRDRTALAFDWRRISRKAPDILGSKAENSVTPHVATWGQTNRLLAGPFASKKAAQAAVSALKADGVDSFTFTSNAGQEIDQLP